MQQARIVLHFLPVFGGELCPRDGLRFSLHRDRWWLSLCEVQRRIGFILVRPFESLLGIVSSAVLEPRLKLGFLTRSQKTLVCQQTENGIYLLNG